MGQDPALKTAAVINTNRWASCFWTMKDKDIVKFKFGLATVSLILLLTGSGLLFDSWKTVFQKTWLFIGLIVYLGLFPSYKTLRTKNVQIILKGVEVMGTVTSVVMLALATIMTFIFLPHISILFFGLTLIIISVNFGVQLIVFDYDNNMVIGLFEEELKNINQLTVNIADDFSEIEINTLDLNEKRTLKRDSFNNKVWTRLMENFSKIKTGT